MAARTARLGVALALAAAAGGCGADEPDFGAAGSEPSAGTWRTWALSSPGDIHVPPPPREGSAAAARDSELARAAFRDRSAQDLRQVRAWGTRLAVAPWLERSMALVAARPKDPPAASRAYALVAVAMYDAAVAAWHWKHVYKRPAPAGEALVERPPDPSYPSEHAAIAGAASRVLAYAFPGYPRARLDAAAEDAARARVVAGAAHPSDVEAGLRLGRAVAGRVIARAERDGVDRRWNGRRPRGPRYWDPPPGSAARPVQPLAGTWSTWVLRSGSELRPGPPPRLGSARFLEEAREVVEVERSLTPEQKRIAKFWEGGEGTELPPGIWIRAMIEYLRARPSTTPREARVFALIAVAMSDAGVAAWDAKYAYWSPRPENAIRDLGIAPKWKPYLATPFFPAYVSGHATYSGAAGEVLAHLFPRDADLFRRRADEASVSRLYGGIHFRADNEVGVRMGREIGRRVVAWAKRDGADR